jgi:hypothetical protein
MGFFSRQFQVDQLEHRIFFPAWRGQTITDWNVHCVEPGLATKVRKRDQGAQTRPRCANETKVRKWDQGAQTDGEARAKSSFKTS